MELGRSRYDLIGRLVLAGFQAGKFRHYAVALLLVALACAFRAGALFLNPKALLFPSFYPAVLAATLYGGVWPGVTACVVSVLVVWAAFMAPADVLSVPYPDQIFNMAFFFVMAFVLVWISASYRRLILELQAEDERRNLLVSEIQHRNRNTLAVTQAIVSQTLREQKELAQAVNDRLGALARSNELFISSSGVAVPLVDVVASTLSNFDPARYAITGCGMKLEHEQARNLGLILHELGTNAAKYGALSTDRGRISIHCKREGQETILTWLEEGGPPASEPTRQGFGSYFIDRLASSLHASAKRTYGPAGLRFELRIPDRRDAA